MSDSLDTHDDQPASGNPSNPAATCPLDERAQTRNLVLFGVNTGLFYLASPVLLVGRVQATLCQELGASDTVANLPGSAYLVLSVMPAIVAWLYPQAALLKRVLVVCYAILALTGALVAALLVLPAPNWLKIAAVVAQGGATGGALTVATMFLFEVLGRGVAASRHGSALSLGYGVGPALAVAASLCTQLVLDGHLGPLRLATLAFPREFAAVFAASVPIMLLAALLSTRFVIPVPTPDAVRQGRFLPGVFGGLREFLSHPVLRTTTVVAVLIFAGYQIGDNMTLYTQEALGEAAKKYVGYQLALRYTFKILSGLIMGWLLTRAHPKASLLATALCGLAGVIWAIAAPGIWFLLSFGLLGAGELCGIYVTNYVLCCSTQAESRRNLGFAAMMLFPAAPAGTLFGRISDHFSGTHSHAFGLRLSFAAAALCIAAAILLAMWRLPSRPGPKTRS